MQERQVSLNKIDRTQSKDTWICVNCSFANLAFLPYCQICESKRQGSSEIKSINRRTRAEQKKEEQKVLIDKQQDKAQKAQQSQKQDDGFKCSKCTYLNPQLTQQCQMCGQDLTRGKKKVKVSQDKIIMNKCLFCGYQNIEGIIRCQKCKKKIPKARKVVTIKRRGRPFYGLSGSNKVCPHCSTYYTDQFHVEQCYNMQHDIQDESKIVYPKQCPFCLESTQQVGYKQHSLVCKQTKKFYENNKSWERLTDLQRDTIIYMHKKCQKKHLAARGPLLKKVIRLGFEQKDLDNLHHYIMHYAPIIIHMHVNTHMQFFVKDTHYRNQFETGKSSGSLSRDSRINWEDRMFDRKHHNATDYQRCKYGTINFTNDPKGVRACSSYGQSYFLLKQEVRDRCTFTDCDSSSSMAIIGTFRFCFQVLNKMSDVQLKAAIDGSKANEIASMGVVGTYKEIQVHGPIEFKEDIQRVYVNKAETVNITSEDPMKLVKQFCQKNGTQYEMFQYQEQKGLSGSIFGSSGFSFAPSPFVSSPFFSSIPSMPAFSIAPIIKKRQEPKQGLDYI